MNDRAHLFDAAADAAFAKEIEIARVTDQVMDDDALLLEAIDGDAYDVLGEVIRALIGSGDPLERFFNAERILIRRARHYAEGQVCE